MEVYVNMCDISVLRSRKRYKLHCVFPRIEHELTSSLSSTGTTMSTGLVTTSVTTVTIATVTIGKDQAQHNAHRQDGDESDLHFDFAVKRT